MKRMPCQACRRDESGCYTCGGYGYILEKSKCRLCKREAWFRPGAHTVYEGKHYSSFDGLEFVWHVDGANCIHCESK